MSLVNDMLRDLEKRKRLPENAARVGGIMGVHQEEKNKSPWLLIAVVLIGIGLGVGGGFWYSKISSTGVVEESFEPAVQIAELSTLAEANDLEVTASPKVISAKINQDNIFATGFEISLVISEKVPFEIVSKSTYGINLFLPGVSDISTGRIDVEGVNISASETGTTILIELPQDSEFKVYEESNDGDYIVVIESNWIQLEQAVTGKQEQTIQAEEAQEVVIAVPTIINAEPRVPVRTDRALSLEAQDKNASLAAAKQIQQGQINAAYTGLAEFIAENPEAHQSRQTFATLLLAQESYEQATMLVDEGLLLAPNYSGYKKIKARLLMRNQQSSEALSLLEQVPPRIVNDAEYHELLATLYQQLGRHSKAIEVYQDLLRVDRIQGKYWVGMAISLEAVGNVNAAVSSFQAGLQDIKLESGLRKYSQNRVSSLSHQL